MMPGFLLFTPNVITWRNIKQSACWVYFNRIYFLTAGIKL